MSASPNNTIYELGSMSIDPAVFEKTLPSEPVKETSKKATPVKETSKKTTFCGRVYQKIVPSTRTIFTISLVIGLIFLVVGLLALAAYAAPQTGSTFTTFLNKINTGLSFIAAKLGTDPYLIAVFTASIGLALTFAGGVGRTIQNCQESAKMREFELTNRKFPFEPTEEILIEIDSDEATRLEEEIEDCED